MQAKIVLLEGDGSVRAQPLMGDQILGSGARCQVRIQGDPKVSTLHARIFFQKGAFFITTYDEVSPVFVNKTRIQTATRLNLDDTIEIGSQKYRFELFLPNLDQYLYPMVNLDAATGSFSGGDYLEKKSEAEYAPNVTMLFPLAAVFKDKPWRYQAYRLLFFAGALPILLVVIWSLHAVNFALIAWVYAAYFAIGWGVALRALIRPGQIPTYITALTWITTILAGTLLVVVINEVPAIKSLLQLTRSAQLPEQFVGWTLAVGIPEEGVKIIPVLVFGFFAKSKLKPADFMYLGVISGLTFGVAEAIGYSIMYSKALEGGSVSLATYFSVQLARLISLPLLHGCFAGIFGYFVGLARIPVANPAATIGLGWIVAALLHGTYNTFAGSYAGFFIAFAILLLFITYARYGTMMAALSAER